MKISIERENLLTALQAVANVVERRQTLPILSNVLISVEREEIVVTATDMEVEAMAKTGAEVSEAGQTTVPGRKLFDICKSLPAQAQLTLEEKEGKVRIMAGRSRFMLSTLPANEYPSVGFSGDEKTFSIESATLAEIIARTQFAMAHQDVRYYLNGLLLEAEKHTLKAVATDGHRLALCERNVDTGVEPLTQIIVPRKGVAEISRLANHAAETLTIGLTGNFIRVRSGNQSLTVKLIDGKFPDYERVVPKGGTRTVTAERELLRAALQRTSILSNEKFRGVRLQLTDNLLKASAHNPEQEEAEEEIAVSYDGEPMEIGFNVSYLLDVLGVLDSEKIKIALSDSNSSCLLSNPDEPGSQYVVMPMRL